MNPFFFKVVHDYVDMSYFPQNCCFAAKFVDDSTRLVLS